VRPPASADQPHGHVHLLLDPSYDSSHILHMFGSLAETRKVGTALPIGRSIEGDNHYSMLHEQSAVSDNEVIGSPPNSCTRGNL
jgi:hypothetical protein